MCPERLCWVTPLRISEIDPTLIDPIDPGRSESDRSDPDRSESDRSDPDRSDPDRSDPDRSDPDRSEPDRSDPDQSNPDRFDPDRSESDRDSTLIDPTPIDPTLIDPTLISGCKHDTKLILMSILTFSRSRISKMLKTIPWPRRLTLELKVTHIHCMTFISSGCIHDADLTSVSILTFSRSRISENPKSVTWPWCLTLKI